MQRHMRSSRPNRHTRQRGTRALVAAMAGGMLVLASSLVATPSFAQGASKPSRITPFALGKRDKTGVEISVSYQFYLGGPTDTLEEQTDLSNEGRRALYKLMARECDSLLETIAETCHLDRANVTSQISTRRKNRFRSGRSGLRISGAATYRIKLKPASGTRPDNARSAPVPKAEAPKAEASRSER